MAIFRELDGPTFWIVTALAIGYWDYKILASRAALGPMLLFAGMAWCVWRMASAYDEFLEEPVNSESKSTRANAAAWHMILFGCVILAMCAAACLSQAEAFPGGRGRLLLTGGFAGVVMIGIGVRVRPFPAKGRKP